MKYWFFGFFFAFLLIVSVIVIPTNIYNREYEKLFLYLGIVFFMLVISISLLKYFLSMASDFKIMGDKIFFEYDNKTIELHICHIKAIKITPYRYIFYFSNNKIFVSRIYGQFKLESDINEQIHTLINQFKIPVY